MRSTKSRTASRSSSLGETPCSSASSRSRSTELDSGAMPVYEYRCQQCQERFEEYLSTSTKPAPPCPKCGASRPTRLFRASAPNGCRATWPGSRQSQLGLTRRRPIRMPSSCGFAASRHPGPDKEGRAVRTDRRRDPPLLRADRARGRAGRPAVRRRALRPAQLRARQRRLPRAGFRLLCFDARGYGASSRPREVYTIEGWAADGARSWTRSASTASSSTARRWAA